MGARDRAFGPGTWRGEAASREWTRTQPRGGAAPQARAPQGTLLGPTARPAPETKCPKGQQEKRPLPRRPQPRAVGSRRASRPRRGEHSPCHCWESCSLKNENTGLRKWTQRSIPAANEGEATPTAHGPRHGLGAGRRAPGTAGAAPAGPPVPGQRCCSPHPWGRQGAGGAAAGSCRAEAPSAPRRQ